MIALSFPGVRMWSVWQPDRGMYFNSFAFERDSGLVAVDPLDVTSLDREWIASRGGLRTIVLTNRDHVRASERLRGEYGARVLVPELEASLFEIPIDGTFRDGQEVFEGAFAIAIPHGKTAGEAALHLPALRAAVLGDAVIGVPAGAVSTLPAERLADPAAFFAGLRKLWSLQLVALMTGDGHPLFSGADEALGTLIEAEGGTAVNRINADEVVFEDERDHPRFQSLHAEVGLLIGARKLGYRLARVHPGSAFCPMHWHQTEEEFFFVLEGTPSVRTHRGTVACRPGDFIAFPTGERGTHQLRNDSPGDCLVLLVGINSPEEVCVYPDSKKMLADLGDRSLMVRSAPNLDYFDGE